MKEIRSAVAAALLPLSALTLSSCNKSAPMAEKPASAESTAAQLPKKVLTDFNSFAVKKGDTLEKAISALNQKRELLDAYRRGAKTDFPIGFLIREQSAITLTPSTKLVAGDVLYISVDAIRIIDQARSGTPEELSKVKATLTSAVGEACNAQVAIEAENAKFFETDYAKLARKHLPEGFRSVSVKNGDTLNSLVGYYFDPNIKYPDDFMAALKSLVVEINNLETGEVKPGSELLLPTLNNVLDFFKRRDEAITAFTAIVAAHKDLADKPKMRELDLKAAKNKN